MLRNDSLVCNLLPSYLFWFLYNTTIAQTMEESKTDHLLPHYPLSMLRDDQLCSICMTLHELSSQIATTRILVLILFLQGQHNKSDGFFDLSHPLQLYVTSVTQVFFYCSSWL